MACASSSMDIVADDDLADSAPLCKRRRLSDREDLQHTRCATPIATRSKKPVWHSDGDIVLDVEGSLLKVHKDRLSCSSVFSDMLQIPQPPDSETDWIDGCPRVALPGDTVADWEATLRWIYHRNAFLAQESAAPFSTLAGTLRLATKYDIPALRAWVTDQLLARWPPDVLHMRLTALPHAAEAIALARECTLPQILPAAFYALAVQRFACGAEGGRAHVVLARDDLRRLVAGREALQDALVRILVDPLVEAGYTTNSTYTNGYTTDEACNAQCVPRRAAYWRARLAPDARAPYGPWLVRELDAMLRDGAFADSLCPGCRRAHLGTVKWRLGRLRGGMAGFFLL